MNDRDKNEPISIDDGDIEELEDDSLHLAFRSVFGTGKDGEASSAASLFARPKTESLVKRADAGVDLAVAATPPPIPSDDTNVEDSPFNTPAFADDAEDFASFEGEAEGDDVFSDLAAIPSATSSFDDASISELREAADFEVPENTVEIGMPGVMVKEGTIDEVMRAEAKELVFHAPGIKSITSDPELRIELPDEPPARDTKAEWSVNTVVTGRINFNLTEEVWAAERLPYGQEQHVPRTAPSAIFEIERPLAKGKHGTVYLAHIQQTNEAVALKILSKRLSDNLLDRQRFRREIRAHAALSHPNIVPVLRYGRTKGRFYLATELLEGSLRDLMRQLGPMPTALSAILLEDLLKGIHFAHTRQVVHRELKPSNLLFSREGVLKIGDFGFAKYYLDPNESVPGIAIGTAAAMSPEQASGEDIGPRSDLFSIATLGFELLTGEHPYQQENDADTLRAVREAKMPEPLLTHPSVHPHLSAIIAAMGKRELSERPESAYEALRRLWPLARMAQKRYPRIRDQFVRNPRKIAHQLRVDESRLEVARGDRIRENNKGGAFIAYHRAASIHHGCEAAYERLDAMRKSDGFVASLDVKSTARWLRSAEDAQAEVIKARGEGRVWDYFTSLREVVAKSPHDHMAVANLEELYSERATSPFDKGKKREEIDEEKVDVGVAERERGAGSTMIVKLPSFN